MNLQKQSEKSNDLLELGYACNPFIPIQYKPTIIKSKSAKTDVKNAAYKKSEGEYLKIEKP